jgi:hypothetical protein
MLTMLTTDDFAAWFRELPDLAAEEIATGLELIEMLGPEANPPNSSELLLWYESASGIAEHDRFYRLEYVPVVERVRHIMQHLNSDDVRERMTKVSLQRAQRASDALQSLRGRLWPMLQHPASQSEALVNTLQARYATVLEALDLKAPPPAPPSSALRELSLRKTEPGMRVLYGVDVANKRALAVLGEVLDRNAYGPSVRKALALWQEFRNSTEVVPLTALTARSSR